MISVEAYLSIVNYEGIGASGAPIMGDVLILTPARSMTPMAGRDRRPPKAVSKPDKRPTSWSNGFQKKFSGWLSGKGALSVDLGYTRAALMVHLEKQFSQGMTWGSYAGSNPYRCKSRTWVVDHIVPKHLFSQDDARHAYALSNLRPLWIDANLRKGCKRVHLL